MELKLSELAETSDEAVITLWHVSAGATVEKGQDILEVSTDKATFDVQSPCSGIVTDILRKEGETVSVDEAIAIIRKADNEGRNDGRSKPHEKTSALSFYDHR